MTSELTTGLNALLAQQGAWESSILETREMVLSNLAMVAQNPAPTFNEKARSEFLIERLVECGVSAPQTDELYNVFGKLNGGRSSRNILITTHMDNQYDGLGHQGISITEERVCGVGLAEDDLALAVLMTLPDIIGHVGMELNSNVTLLGSTRFHGRGDFAGIRHYLKNSSRKPDFVINLSGINHGQLDYFTLSRVRCDIQTEIPMPSDAAWMRATNNSAIIVANEIVNGLLSIPLARKPKTVLNIGMISGGERYSTVSREATVHLELLSEEDEVTDALIETIQDMVLDVGARHGVKVKTDFFGRHLAAGLTTSHPLVKATIEILKHQDVAPAIEFSNTEISVPLSMDIPSVSVGLTTGMGGNTPVAYVDIPPLTKGILQLITLLQLIDGGYCDE